MLGNEMGSCHQSNFAKNLGWPNLLNWCAESAWAKSSWILVDAGLITMRSKPQILSEVCLGLKSGPGAAVQET